MRGDEEEEYEEEHDARVQWIYCCDGPYAIMALNYLIEIIYTVVIMVMNHDTTWKSIRSLEAQHVRKCLLHPSNSLLSFL